MMSPELRAGIENMLQQHGKIKTYEHVLAVSKIGERIAAQYGLDNESCIISALLHDISAILSPAEQLEFAKKRAWTLYEAELKYPFLLHQRVAAVMAKERFQIDDERILCAIACHTTLKAQPSDYDMALFIADKLSWDQNGRPPFYDRVFEQLQHSLEAASLAYINYLFDNNMLMYPHPWALEAKEWMEKRRGGFCDH